MKSIVRMQDICKEYGSCSVLNHINMQIHEGDIYGFVGANGAGKTTTIRILTGLTNQTCGEIQLFGYSGKGNLRRQRSRIGCIIEMPAIYDSLTVYQNLEVQRIQRGIPGKDCIDRVMKIIGLEDEAKKMAVNLSVGMRQRLALGIALLGEPEFLILDEPTNGLDPNATMEIRNLLKKINQEHHVTMLISSHILSELNQLATCYGFLNEGVLVEQITAAELKEKCKKYISINVTDMERAVRVLEGHLQITDYEIASDTELHLNCIRMKPEEISSTLMEYGIGIRQFAMRGENLEEYFTKMVGGRIYGQSD